VTDLAGGGEQPLDVRLGPEVGDDGPDAQFGADGVEFGRAAGDRDFAALGNEFGGEARPIPELPPTITTCSCTCFSFGD
jgi:hypothetical protein